MENRCVCCGEIIPEGRQVCFLCELEAEHAYRVPGEYDTYSQYNEGWTDALDRVRGRLKSIFREREEAQKGGE